MRRSILVVSLLYAGLLGGCVNLAPDYQRPALPVPVALDGKAESGQQIAKIDWQQVVTDARLRQVVDLALANNRDLRIAVLNIDKARAQYRIADADRYPAIGGSAGSSASRSGGNVSRNVSASVGMSSYELDFFGRLTNLKDAALQDVLALESTQRSVRTSLIAEVASAWLTLAGDQAQLHLAQETWQSRQTTLELTRKQQAMGGASGLDVAQAQASAETARGDVARYTSLVAQDRHALDLLAGTSVPQALLPKAGDSLDTSLVALLEVPADLSSEVLLQRPDIQSAEYTLIGAHADIGAARAAFFPSISLTAATGSASASLGNLFEGASRTWSFAPTLTLPIFNAGSLKASLSAAEITRDIQVATYEKAIQTAFQEVADALAERSTLTERMAAQQAQVDAYANSLRLSTERYRSGADSYLSVLDSQRSLYSAQQSLISLRLSEQSNRMTLFKVLGGQ